MSLLKRLFAQDTLVQCEVCDLEMEKIGPDRGFDSDEVHNLFQRGGEGPAFECPSPTCGRVYCLEHGIRVNPCGCGRGTMGSLYVIRWRDKDGRLTGGSETIVYKEDQVTHRLTDLSQLFGGPLQIITVRYKSALGGRKW